MKFVLLIAIFSLSPSIGWAQQQLQLDLETSPPPVLPPLSVLSLEDEKAVVEAVTKTINDYALLVSMKDPEEMLITEASQNRFKRLFVANAEVVHDYLEQIPEKTIALEHYIEEAYTHFEREGIQMKIGRVSLLKIENDPVGYFVVHVLVEKHSFNYVSSDMSVHKSDGGRYMLQEFIFDKPKREQSEARIRGIRPYGLEKKSRAKCRLFRRA